MFLGKGGVERSLNAYPGKISTVLDVYCGNSSCANCRGLEEEHRMDINLLKKNLLDENPFVGALFLDSCNWNISKGVVEWAHSNNLSVGLGINNLSLGDIKKAMDSGMVDFARIDVNKKNIEGLKKSFAIVRSSGIKHELLLPLDSGQLKLDEVEKMYKEFSPCDSFVIEVSSKDTDFSRRRDFVEFASRNQSVFLRMW